ncbi:MAG: HNH endonuclease [Proteobacteria bacterium]|jgi:hypothetical protein|nr:HNH endonuclease [Pseudomonadota bacterium]
MNKRKIIGKKHPNFLTGKSIDANGYVILSSKIWGENINRREHRVVMEEKIGRKLRPDEIVHHKNENKSDNRPENLSLETRRSHNRAHGKGGYAICSSCGKERWYVPALLKKIKPGYKCGKCYHRKAKS